MLIAVDRYVEFLPEVQRSEIVERHDDGVTASFGMRFSFAGVTLSTSYVLRYTFLPDGMRWALVSSPQFHQSTGHWRLEDVDGQTVAYFEGEVALHSPVSPEILKIFAEEQLPRMMKRFRDRAEG